ncbi:hypothetical protein Pan97_16380 [Bremerella volcania]|uniref:BON domain-containing protein n=1 Tax=Bremerella volcania TaxID=2527984 RepID=A0A518C5X0_9BACT|nr:BON domain-containing protein [Bremerella volcania]QDU74626.1 hypothetical protein Pan97_16380 [Bremerella volcania]
MSIGPALELPPDTNAVIQPQCRSAKRRRTKVEGAPPTRPAAITDPVVEAQAERDGMLETQARAELHNSAYHAVRQVSCEVRDCTLTLRGRLPSFHLKQIAQTVVRRVDGIVIIDNQVEVDRA